MTTSMWGDAAAERLREARQFLGWSCERLAEDLSEMVDWDVDAGVLGAWEGGRGTVPGDILLAAEALRLRDVRGRRLRLVGAAR
jgi:hypothetical protein